MGSYVFDSWWSDGWIPGFEAHLHRFAVFEPTPQHDFLWLIWNFDSWQISTVWCPMLAARSCFKCILQLQQKFRLCCLVLLFTFEGWLHFSFNHSTIVKISQCKCRQLSQCNPLIVSEKFSNIEKPSTICSDNLLRDYALDDLPCIILQHLCLALVPRIIE